jgi:hypothetical protein
VTIPLTTNNHKEFFPSESPSDSPSESPTQSPAPTKAPTAATKACTSMECLLKILRQNDLSGSEALQDDSSP